MTGQPALTPYVPRLLLRHLDETPDAAVRSFDGTLVFIDVSGFTQLSERLARQGREGAERLADAIGRCFTTLLTVAYESGGGLLKFGGDALLLLFDGDGHAERACRAAAGMRSALREAGRLDEGGVRVKLRMSVGVHSGECTFFVTRGDHRELLVTGPAATQVVRMEQAAATGQIVVSDDTAARLPAACTRPATGPGRLLRSAPAAAGDPPPQRRLAPSGAIAWSRRSRLCSERICRTAPAHRSTGWSRSRSSASAASSACWREPVRRPSRTRSTSSSPGPPAQPRGTACACSARTWTRTEASCC